LTLVLHKAEGELVQGASPFHAGRSRRKGCGLQAGRKDLGSQGPLREDRGQQAKDEEATEQGSSSDAHGGPFLDRAKKTLYPPIPDQAFRGAPHGQATRLFARPDLRTPAQAPRLGWLIHTPGIVSSQDGEVKRNAPYTQKPLILAESML
jgi:hypothetical protein